MKKNRVKAYVRVGYEFVTDAVIKTVNNPVEITAMMLAGWQQGSKYKGSWKQAAKGVAMSGAIFAGLQLVSDLVDEKDGLSYMVNRQEALYDMKTKKKSEED